MTLWNRLRNLALDVTSLHITELSQATSPQWTRRTRCIEMRGSGPTGQLCSGSGEDVSWVEVSPEEILALYPEDLLCFRGSFEEWSARLDAREATPAYQTLAAGRRSDPDYLRWGLESAAMELALRQNQTTLAAVLDRQPQTMRFCLSMGLGQPPTAERLHAWRAHGDYSFKLDASSDWTAELLNELHAMRCVEVVDLKAYYHDTPVDQPVDPALYERVAQGLPEVVLEDALPNDDTREILRPHRQRLSWDAPIHEVADVARIVPADFGTPTWINIKPSRFGSWQRLLAMYEWAEQHQVSAYGGGQFELGIGREHAQALACLFHPHEANDIAPALFHSAEPQPGLPVNQLAPDALTQTVWLAAGDTPR